MILDQISSANSIVLEKCFLTLLSAKGTFFTKKPDIFHNRNWADFFCILINLQVHFPIVHLDRQ